MYIYSLILIGLFLYNLGRTASYKSKLVFQTTVTAWVYLFTNRGYFFESSILNIDNWQAAIIMEFMLLLMGKKIVKISKRMAAFFACLCISVISLAVFPASQARVVGNAGSYELFMAGLQQYTSPQFTKFSVFLFALAAIQALVFDGIYRNFEYEDTKKVVLNLAELSKFVLVIGIIEFIVKNVLHSNIYNDIMVFIFGRGSSAYARLVQRGSLYMLTGLSREGSQYVFTLGIAIVLLFAEKKLKRSQSALVWIIIALLLMAFSGAFTLVISILMLLVFYSIYYINKTEGGKKRIGRILGYAVGLLVLAVVGVAVYDSAIASDNYITARLASAFNTLRIVFPLDGVYYTEWATIDSTTTRMYSVVDALRNGMYRPLFGLGEGTTYCHGCAALMIAEIGLMGTMAYIWFYFGRYLKEKSFSKIAKPLLLTWFTVSMISGGAPRMYIGLDGVVIMMAAYVIYISEGKGSSFDTGLESVSR